MIMAGTARNGKIARSDVQSQSPRDLVWGVWIITTSVWRRDTSNL
jgi:hypothetical protein